MDIFELASRRNVSVNALMQGSDSASAIEARGQRHSKRDYESLKTMTIKEIVMMTGEKQVKKPFEDDSLAKGMVKVEKKKAFKKKRRAQ